MPAKFKPSQKVLVDRVSKKFKTVHFYLKSTPTEELVKEMVTHGLGVMPAYGEGILTKEEIDIVSFYVANSAGK